MACYIQANRVCAKPNLGSELHILIQGLSDFLDVAEKNAGLYLRYQAPEALHQYRVALRQARALSKANKKGVLGPENYRLVNQALRGLVAPTGGLRDSEVLIERLEQSPPGEEALLVTGWKQVLADMRWEAEKQRKHLLTWFKSEIFTQHMSTITRLLAQWAEAELDDTIPDDDTIAISNGVADYITKQQNWLADRLNRLDKMPPASLHALRIRVKNLRYTLHFYQRDPDSETELHKNKKLQHHLGLLHDYEVQRELMLSYIAQKQLDDRNIKPAAMFVGCFLCHAKRLSAEQLEQVHQFVVE